MFSSRLSKEAPVLDLEGAPDAGGVLDGVADELALLPELQVHFVLVVLSLDVRHVDRDEDVRLLLLQAQKRHDEGGEVRAGGPVLGSGGLGRDESIGRRSGSGDFFVSVQDTMKTIVLVLCQRKDRKQGEGGKARGLVVLES